MAVTRDSVVVLYGSRARAEQDEVSDLDLLFLCEAGAECSEPGQLEHAGYPGAAASQYSWQEFESMAASGSLFLRHLKNEGILLCGEGSGSERYLGLLADLGPYRKVKQDVRSFRSSLDDVRASLTGIDPSESFEASVLATIVRHASILGCYLLGIDEYGRYEAVRRFVEAAEMPACADASFRALYMYRLAQDHRIGEMPDPSPVELDRWLTLADMVVEKLTEVSRAS